MQGDCSPVSSSTRSSGSSQRFYRQLPHGVIEGDQVKLRSQVSRPGDTIPFLFAGRAADNRISGFIHLGEYRNADFTACRSQYAKSPISISIPGGAPLAT